MSESEARPGSRDEIAEVFARVAHELKTPVSVAKGFAMTVRDNFEDMDAETLKRCYATIIRALAVAENIVQALEETRSVESGDVRLDLTPVLVGEFVTETVQDLELLTQPHHLSIAVLNDGRAWIDRLKVRQILTNLLSNAAKFSPADAPIAVDVGGDARWLEIAVTDEGPGIPPDRIEEAFDKFERLGSDVKGTGLGLYIARGLARAHGGDLCASSDGRNGSRFVLRLPVDPEQMLSSSEGP